MRKRHGSPRFSHGFHAARAGTLAVLMEPFDFTSFIALRRDAKGGRWCWTDPARQRVLVAPDGGRRQSHKLRDRAHTVAPCASGALLLGIGKRLCLLPAAGGLPRVLATVDAADPRTAIGDGRTDGAGAFVFGTSNASPDGRPIGSFFHFSAAGLRRLALPTVTRAAGICFSTDGRHLMLADADGGALLRCRYDADGATVSGLQRFAAALPGLRITHAVTDSDDSVWTAQGAPGKHPMLVRYAPDGTLCAALDAGPLAGIACGIPGSRGAPVASPAGDAPATTAAAVLMTVQRDGRLRPLTVASAGGSAETPFDDAAFGADAPGHPNPLPPRAGPALRAC